VWWSMPHKKVLVLPGLAGNTPCRIQHCFRWPACTRFGTEAQLLRKGDRAHQSGASLSMQKASLRDLCAWVVGMCQWRRAYRVSERLLLCRADAQVLRRPLLFGVLMKALQITWCCTWRSPGLAVCCVLDVVGVVGPEGCWAFSLLGLRGAIKAAHHPTLPPLFGLVAWGIRHTLGTK
jgi:hypothetical protein